VVVTHRAGPRAGTLRRRFTSATASRRPWPRRRSSPVTASSRSPLVTSVARCLPRAWSTRCAWTSYPWCSGPASATSARPTRSTCWRILTRRSRATGSSTCAIRSAADAWLGTPHRGRRIRTADAMLGGVVKTRSELGEFLRSHRERLTPEQVGLPSGVTLRRVPGLRREELAQLAGVSVGYYTRLEQGVSRAASPAVLDALAMALQLDDAEHRHLRTLAQPPRKVRRRARRSVLRPTVADLLATFDDVAAIVIDHRTDVVGWNRLGHALLAGHVDPGAPQEPSRPNIARMLFLDPHHRAL